MKLILSVLFVLLASTVYAAPFLVCDIPPADYQITAVAGMIDGTAFTTPYTVHGTDLLVYDIGTLSSAKHSFTNVRFQNARGESAGVPFDIPSLPGQPAALHLAP